MSDVLLPVIPQLGSSLSSLSSSSSTSSSSSSTSTSITSNYDSAKDRLQHRRCSSRPPPSLLRQADRKANFVDNLVDSASQIVEIIWPLAVSSASRAPANGAEPCKGVLPLRTFIQETLRRSRTSYSTLQVALYYLILIKPHVHDGPLLDASRKGRALQCGRRMFLAALILASKYLQDRNYSARAWSKISGLNTAEINANELLFLHAVDWRLHISDTVFQRWNDIVLRYTPNSNGIGRDDGSCWQTVIPGLTPKLDSLDGGSRDSRDSPNGWTAAVSSVGSPVDSGASTPSTPACHSPVSYPSAGPAIIGGGGSGDVTLPSLPRLGLLPTPQLTPQATLTSTPAASMRPSICAALSTAQSSFVQRATLDRVDRQPQVYVSKQPSFDFPRRSSLARSSSFTSSPESLASDAPSFTFSTASSAASSVGTGTSRSSRSSSISSVTSMSCIRSNLGGRPQPANCLKDGRRPLAISTPIDELEPTYTASPSPVLATLSAGAVPDLSNFNLNTPSTSAAAAAAAAAATTAAIQGLYELATGVPLSAAQPQAFLTEGQNRKRTRTLSTDSSDSESALQQKVRHMLALDARNAAVAAVLDDGLGFDVDMDVPVPVLRDSRIADSVLSHRKSSPNTASKIAPMGVNVKGSAGVKRACCDKENVRALWGI